MIEEARKFNLLSNVFMSVALADIPACQYVIRVITGNADLVVKEVRAQHRISKITSHDAVLDILAEDEEGKIYNLEIQRKDTIDHAKRSRFYAAMIDSEYLQKGQVYADLPEICIIYISETDLWRAGKTVYEVEKRFKNTNNLYDDGARVLYVNAAVDDGSAVADLMKYFKTADSTDMSHGDLSKRVQFLKSTEGGYEFMCEVSEKIYGAGREDGKLIARQETALNLAAMGMSVDMIAKAVGVSDELVRQWMSQGDKAKLQSHRRFLVRLTKLFSKNIKNTKVKETSSDI